MTEERHGRSEDPEGEAWHSGGWFRRGRVDPCCGWFGGWNGRFCHEPSGVFAERLIEDDLACCVNGIGLAVMHLVRCHQTNSGMMVVLVVPVKEASAEDLSILDTAESLGE